MALPNPVPNLQSLASQHLNACPGLGLGLQITINCHTGIGRPLLLESVVTLTTYSTLRFGEQWSLNGPQQITQMPSIQILLRHSKECGFVLVAFWLSWKQCIGTS